MKISGNVQKEGLIRYGENGSENAPFCCLLSSKILGGELSKATPTRMGAHEVKLVN